MYAKTLLATLGVAVGMMLPPPAAHAATGCGHAVGPFHQAQAEIWQASGTRYVPLGVTVSGLERPDWRDFTASDTAEISAAAAAWCVNTIRLQVSQQRWAQDGPAYRDAVAAEISHAENLGMVTAVNDNTQWDTTRAGMPTAATRTFWHSVASRYAADPQIVFDLFNEPRRGTGWHCWHDGGTACATPGLVGMQPLARYVRSLAPNLIWIDGPGSQLDKVRSWPVSGARPMAYSVHHPDGPHTVANWSHQFGWLAEQRYAPVVDGEWTNFAASRAECWKDAPQRVPAFLAYLARLRIGLGGVWKLGPWDQPGTTAGVLTTTSPAAATGFGAWAAWRCTNGYHHSAGKVIRAWFEQLNGG